tara:strand:- start:257 stop:718 length:462 start_codon:yes stop_codon:yes gene_type:complete
MNNKDIPQEALPLIQAFLAQMSSAMKVSEILADHNSKDKEIRPDDIIGGLVYRLMVPMNSEEIESSMSSAKQIIDKLDETDSEESEEEYDGVQECYSKEVGPRKVKAPICNCDICSKVRISFLNYKNHECLDPLAERFKKAINHSCEQHKLFI